MPITEPTATNANLTAVVSDYNAGQTGGQWRTNLNANQDSLETRDKLIQAYQEQRGRLLGYGWISGGEVTIGTGLSVNVAAYEADLGNYQTNASTQIVGGLAASQTNYLFLRQNGTWTINQTGVTPSGQPALLWAIAVTNTTNVTSVNNNRAVFRPMCAGFVQKDEIAYGENMRVPYGYTSMMVGPVTVNGVLIVDGRMEIFNLLEIAGSGSGGGTGGSDKHGLLITLCQGFTPSGTGADVAELVVPYDPADGTTSVTWAVRRLTLRVGTAGGAPSVRFEKSTASGAFSAATIGDVTLSSGANEGSNTSSFTNPTVESGNKIRFNALALGTASYWTCEVELEET